jgi:hypothetical protein
MESSVPQKSKAEKSADPPAAEVRATADSQLNMSISNHVILRYVVSRVRSVEVVAI